MKNKHLKLTKDQKARNVIMSSQLKAADGSAEPGELQEVKRGHEDAREQIERLRDASFFDGSQWDVNEIRQ